MALLLVLSIVIMIMLGKQLEQVKEFEEVKDMYVTSTTLGLVCANQ
jgi:hypothetical protein